MQLNTGVMQQTNNTKMADNQYSKGITEFLSFPIDLIDIID
jgi:hypothetical protein